MKRSEQRSPSGLGDHHMTLSGLRARAKVKGAKVKSAGGLFTLIDARNDLTIGTAGSLIELEDAINWIDEL